MIRPASSQARDLLANAVQAQGSAWRNAADSIRAGNACNAWIVAGLAAIDDALRTGLEDGDEAHG